MKQFHRFLLFLALCSFPLLLNGESKFKEGVTIGSYTFSTLPATASQGRIVYVSDRYALYLYNGAWNPIASNTIASSSTAHNATTAKQGGQASGSQYYHLNLASHSLVTSHPARTDNPHAVTLAQVGGVLASWTLNAYNGPSTLKVTGDATLASTTSGGSTTFTIDVSGGGSITASPTMQDSPEIDFTKDADPTINSFTAALVSAGVKQSKIYFANASSPLKFISTDGTNFFWRSATDTNTVASFSLNSYNGPSVLKVTGSGGTLASATAGGSTTFTLNLTGTAAVLPDIQFTSIYLRPRDGTATPAQLVNVGEDVQVVQLLPSTSSGTMTVWFSTRTIPSNWTDQDLRIKIGYYLTGDASNTEKIKLNVMGTCTKAGQGYSGLLATFTLPVTFLWTASSTNRIVLASTTATIIDIPASNFEAGGNLNLKIQRVAPSATESSAKMRILDVTGVWQ